jgi:hypothetical protein
MIQENYDKNRNNFGLFLEFYKEKLLNDIGLSGLGNRNHIIVKQVPNKMKFKENNEM